jgi:hypothetical protein
LSNAALGALRGINLLNSEEIVTIVAALSPRIAGEARYVKLE